MTNPTLITQDNAWRGFTFDQLVEQMLQRRGVTNSVATYPTLPEASAAELAGAQLAARRAFDLLNVEFPSLYAIRTYTVTWTAGDHSIALPKNVMAIKAVTYRGLSMTPLSDDDYYRVLRSDEEGGGIAADGEPSRYRVVGFSDEDAGSSEGNRDWRLVLRLYPTPGTGYSSGSLVVEYVALANDFESVDASEGGDPIALWPHLQGWCLERATELWLTACRDSNGAKGAETERLKHERTIHSWIERATREPTQRMKWRFPHPSRRARRYRS